MQEAIGNDKAANDAEAAAAADPGASAGHEAATGQPADDYPDLSKEAEAPAEPQPDTAAAEGAPDTSNVPTFYPKRPYSMVWHQGLKAFTQDGNIFDRGSKQYIQKL